MGFIGCELDCSSPSIHPAYNRLAKARKKRKFLNLKGFRSFFMLIYESNIFTLKACFCPNLVQILSKQTADTSCHVLLCRLHVHCVLINSFHDVIGLPSASFLDLLVGITQ